MDNLQLARSTVGYIYNTVGNTGSLAGVAGSSLISKNATGANQDSGSQTDMPMIPSAGIVLKCVVF